MTKKRRILIIGRSGQLAQELARSDWPSLTNLRFVGRKDIDLFDHVGLCRQIEAYAPDAIINAAAYTAVDRAEQEPEEAFLLNSIAAGDLAIAARLLQVPLIQLSTDYVFDGRKDGGYGETDQVSPISVYGKSKAAGELAVMAAGGQHVILRSSWYFSLYGSNFLKTMLRLGRERSALSVVNDQVGCPTPVAAIASTLHQLAVGMIDGHTYPNILHFAGDQPVTWFGFAQEIFAAAQAFQPAPTLTPITTAAFNAPAPRPRNSVLDCQLARSVGLPPADWRAALPHMIKTLAEQQARVVEFAA